MSGSGGKDRRGRAAARQHGQAPVRIRVGDWEQMRAAATAVRFAVFVREQGIPAELELDERDAGAVHAVAFAPSGAPVGTGRLLPDAHIGRMAVLPAARGQGVGAAILRSLVAVAQVKGMQELHLHAQSSALGFYERLGFVAVGDEYQEAGIAHRTMARSLPPPGQRPTRG
ncbi:Acetyltransferase [Burkholderiales bacterium]|nr:Acetyltransferase [Burkholderiales bacterium]